MAGQIPDLGVRLQATGLSELVQAFKKVGAEGHSAGESAAGGFKILETQLESLAELVPAISAGLAVEGLKELIKGSIEAGVEIGHLAEKTGISVQNLSVLKYAAEQNGLSLEDLTKAFKKLSTTLVEYQSGSKAAKKTFDDLGISQQALTATGGDLWKVAELVADRFSKLPDGFRKNKEAADLFGKSGAALIPLLNQGSAAFAQYAQEASALGIVLDEDGVKQLEALHKASLQADSGIKGFGLTLTSIFGPALAGASELAAKLIEKLRGIGSFSSAKAQNFEQYVPDSFAGLGGQALADASANALGRKEEADKQLADLETLNARKLISVKDYYAKKAKLTLQADTAERDHAAARFLAAKDDAPTPKDAGTLALYTQALAGPGQQLKEAAEKLAEAKKPVEDLTPKQTDEDKRKAAEAAKRLDDAKRAYLSARSDNELALAKLNDSLEEQEDKRKYDAGLLSLDEYYDARAARIKKAADAEAAALEGKRETALDTKANPVTDADNAAAEEDRLRRLAAAGKATADDYKRLEAAEKDEAAIAAVRERQASDAHQNELSRAKDTHNLSNQELADLKRLRIASGDKFAAEETGLREELRQYGELLDKQQNLTQVERDAKLASLQARGEAKISYGRAQQDYGTDSADLQQSLRGVQAKAANGSITQLDAEAQILRLEKARLPELERLADEMVRFADATGNDDLKAKAKADKDQVDQLSDSLHIAFNAQTYLVQQLETQGASALEDFFTAGIDGSKSFGDALGDLAKTFEEMVARMIAKLLVLLIFETILGWVDPSGASTAAFEKLSGLGGKSSGGWTGDGPTGAPAAIVHGQEFVVKAGPAAEHRDLLEAMNAGLPFRTQAAFGSAMNATVQAAGGNVVVQPAGTVVNVHTTGPTKQTQTMDSHGTNVIDVIVGKAVAEVDRRIASGGSTAKVAERAYGLTRGGVRRA